MVAPQQIDIGKISSVYRLDIWVGLKKDFCGTNLKEEEMALKKVW